MDEGEIARDDLTSAEAAEAEETGMSGEESHRYEEYEELRSMLSDVLDAVNGLRDGMRELAQQRAAVLVESGAVVTDDGETAIVDEDEYGDALEDLDLTIY